MYELAKIAADVVEFGMPQLYPSPNNTKSISNDNNDNDDNDKLVNQSTATASSAQLDATLVQAPRLSRPIASKFFACASSIENALRDAAVERESDHTRTSIRIHFFFPFLFKMLAIV